MKAYETQGTGTETPQCCWGLETGNGNWLQCSAMESMEAASEVGKEANGVTLGMGLMLGGMWKLYIISSYFLRVYIVITYIWVYL